MLKQFEGAALGAAMQALSPDAERVPLPGELEDDLVRASIMLSSCLSADGTRFDVRCYSGRADLGEDASAEIGVAGASIWIARLPSAILTATAAERFAVVLMIAAHAYIGALIRGGWTVDLDTEEEPFRALARAAAAQPRERLMMAARRLCH